MDSLIQWFSYGLTGWSWLALLAVALATTHFTIICVTVYLHRCQAHRALTLHPAVAHVFRAWLWLSTGMVTREWAAIHRKHHAKCETEEDPHSPQTRGLPEVLWRGAELYRDAAKDSEITARYGHGCPDDWIERHLYSKHSALGVSLLLVIEVLLFGVAGVAVWTVQMMWIPFFAAGVINGVGHFWGYRNFQSPDTSRNILPWGIVVGGEELHNNHHAFATSPKLSSRWYEFDVGWLYIRVLAFFGLAHPRALPPALRSNPLKVEIDAETVQAVMSAKYELQAKLTRLCRKAQDRLEGARLQAVSALRTDFEAIWTQRGLTVEQVISALQDWCQKAEASGVQALSDFSTRLRSLTLQSA